MLIITFYLQKNLLLINTDPTIDPTPIPPTTAEFPDIPASVSNNPIIPINIGNVTINADNIYDNNRNIPPDPSDNSNDNIPFILPGQTWGEAS